MLIAMAALMGERPALIAAGSSSAPTSAMAGEGQMTQATSMMTTPMVQKATSGLTSIFWTGRNIISARPVSSSIFAMATMIEMMAMIPSNSVKATVRELKTAWTALTKLPVTTQASTKEATMHTIGVSLRMAMVTSTTTMKNA